MMRGAHPALSVEHRRTCVVGQKFEVVRVDHSQGRCLLNSIAVSVELQCNRSIDRYGRLSTAIIKNNRHGLNVLLRDFVVPGASLLSFQVHACHVAELLDIRIRLLGNTPEWTLLSDTLASGGNISGHAPVCSICIVKSGSLRFDALRIPVDLPRSSQPPLKKFKSGEVVIDLT